MSAGRGSGKGPGGTGGGPAGGFGRGMWKGWGTTSVSMSDNKKPLVTTAAQCSKASPLPFPFHSWGGRHPQPSAYSYPYT